MSESPSPIHVSHGSTFDLGRRLAFVVLVGIFVVGAGTASVILTRPANTDPGVIGRSGAIRDEVRQVAAETASLAFADHVTDIDGPLPTGWTRLDNHTFDATTGPFASVSVGWYDANGMTLAQVVAQHRSFDAVANRRTGRAVRDTIAGRAAMRLDVRTVDSGETERVWLAVEGDEVLHVSARADSPETLPQVDDVLSRLQVR